jgi:hypothetical protein
MKRLLVKGIPGKCLQKAQLTSNPVKGESTNGSITDPSCIKTAEFFFTHLSVLFALLGLLML